VTPSATIAPASGSYEEWLAAFEYNARLPLGMEELGVEQRDGVTIHDITFASPLEGKIPAYLVMPQGEGPFPAVLYAHWYDSDHSNRKEFLDESVSLAQEGVVCLLVDELFAAPFPRHKWTGRNAEQDRQIVIQQVIELRRALDVLVARPEVDSARIGFVGHDFGALFGAVLSGVDHRLRAYVLMTAAPEFDWFTISSALKPSELRQYRSVLMTVAPIEYVPHAAPAALFFQFARNDGFVPEVSALALFNAASEPKRIEWYKGSEGHVLQRNEQALQDRLEWMRQELRVGK